VLAILQHRVPRGFLGRLLPKEETPSLGTKRTTDYILGMAKTEGNVKILLDIDKVLDSQGSYIPALTQ
jgi:chemotaxis signal transduction protein